MCSKRVGEWCARRWRILLTRSHSRSLPPLCHAAYIWRSVALPELWHRASRVRLCTCENIITMSVSSWSPAFYMGPHRQGYRQAVPSLATMCAFTEQPLKREKEQRHLATQQGHPMLDVRVCCGCESVRTLHIKFSICLH